MWWHDKGLVAVCNVSVNGYCGLVENGYSSWHVSLKTPLDFPHHDEPLASANGAFIDQ